LDGQIRVDKKWIEKGTYRYLMFVGIAIEELMHNSGLRDEQIDAVLRTGGTSEVPVFIDLLADRFGMEKIVELNPFTSIVAGLAIKGANIHLFF